jgi:hypothetical protein
MFLSLRKQGSGKRKNNILRLREANGKKKWKQH